MIEGNKIWKEVSDMHITLSVAVMPTKVPKGKQKEIKKLGVSKGGTER